MSSLSSSSKSSKETDSKSMKSTEATEATTRDLRRQESTLRECEPTTATSILKSQSLDHNLKEAKTLPDGNTTSLVGGLVLTDSDAKSQDRKKFFHGSVKKGVEIVQNDHDKFAIFMAWLEENGADMSGLYLKKIHRRGPWGTRRSSHCRQLANRHHSRQVVDSRRNGSKNIGGQ
jgi:hypothetical protein